MYCVSSEEVNGFPNQMMVVSTIAETGLQPYFTYSCNNDGETVSQCKHFTLKITVFIL